MRSGRSLRTEGDRTGRVAAEAKGRTATFVGVGCFTAFAGWWSGAMIAVLVAKIVGAMQRCPAGERGEPCNWYVYALAGAVIGAITLPIIALRRLRSGEAATGGRTQNEG